MSKQDIKKFIIIDITAMKFPVVWSRDCIDGQYGFLIKSPVEIVAIGYADIGEGPKTLFDLSLSDLAAILDKGETYDKSKHAWLGINGDEEGSC